MATKKVHVRGKERPPQSDRDGPHRASPQALTGVGRSSSPTSVGGNTKWGGQAGQRAGRFSRRYARVLSQGRDPTSGTSSAGGEVQSHSGRQLSEVPWGRTRGPAPSDGGGGRVLAGVGPRPRPSAASLLPHQLMTGQLVHPSGQTRVQQCLRHRRTSGVIAHCP